MWACLQDHDTTNHWKQVAGWRKVCDLAQIHLGRLQEYRRGLAEAWPPETSAASGTYLAQLDDLIAKVRHTHDAAAANYTALSAATQAIGTTRAELRKLHEEYATKLQQKRAYEATAADPKAIMGNRVVDAPVTDSDLERLNVQARAMMFNLSGELQQAQATLRQPPPRPAPRVDDQVPGTAWDTAPVIPPIVSAPIGVSRTLPVVQRFEDSFQAGRLPIEAGIGPVLGGSSTPNTPPIQESPRTSQPVATSTPTVGGIPTPGPISTAPLGTPQSPIGNGRAVGAPVSGLAKGSPSSSPRAMPPGGLIGAPPGVGLGQPSANASPIRRVNPVGGVIGGGGAGTAPAGGAGSRPDARRGLTSLNGVPPFSPPANNSNQGTGSNSSGPARRGFTDTSNRTTKRDPDHPWETDRGVSPIVLPSEEKGPIDPGPAIGFHR